MNAEDDAWGWLNEPDDEPDDYYGNAFYGAVMGSYRSMSRRVWGSEGYVEVPEDAPIEDRVESRAKTILDSRKAARERTEAAEQREREMAFAQTLADLRELPTAPAVEWKPDENGVLIAVPR